MGNYLSPILHEYFQQILQIEARLAVSTSFLASRRDQLLSDGSGNRTLIGSITSYRDLSQIQGGDNLGSPACSYQVKTDNLSDEVDIIISQQCCYAATQWYEVFESYLISMISEYLHHHQYRLREVKLKGERILLLKETIRHMVKKAQGTNNKGLLSMMRKLSGHFKQYEHNNIFSVDISQWFDLYSMIRHTLVHNRQVVSNRLLDYINTRKSNELFEQHFKKRKVDQEVCIYLEKDSAGNITHWLNTFAHFIFVSLSKEGNLSLHVPQYAPSPPPLVFSV